MPTHQVQAQDFNTKTATAFYSIITILVSHMYETSHYNSRIKFEITYVNELNK